MKYSAICVIITCIFVIFVTSEARVEAKKYKVVCYFTNWSWYRKENGKFLPEHIVADLCTHIVYAFTILDPNSLTLQIRDPRTDIDNHFFKRVTDFHEKGIKVTVSIGGWNDSGDEKYGRLLANANARRTFIVNVTEFIENHHFQGLDLDLEVKKSIFHFFLLLLL